MNPPSSTGSARLHEPVSRYDCGPLEALRLDILRGRTAPESGQDVGELISWLERLRGRALMTVEKVGLSDAMLWRFKDPEVTDERIRDCVACLRITLHEREVRSWCQPLMFDPREQFCGLILTRGGGEVRALVQGVAEPGIIGGIQIGPTVQTDGPPSPAPSRPQVYASYFEDLGRREVLFDVEHSEEGGRFFQDKKRYAAILLGESEAPAAQESYRWASIGAIKAAIEMTNKVNVFARTLAAMLS